MQALLLHVCYRMTTMCSTTLNKIYICTYMYRSCMYRMADNETYKESMQAGQGWQRTEQALLDSCGMRCKWCSVDCSLKCH